ncbi:MAG: hypothetical protein M5R40_03435 [Anaerolineae bacterium]|nr:hypothetical protein [Anaerolineae bacterium]
MKRFTFFKREAETPDEEAGAESQAEVAAEAVAEAAAEAVEGAGAQIAEAGRRFQLPLFRRGQPPEGDPIPEKELEELDAMLAESIAGETAPAEEAARAEVAARAPDAPHVRQARRFRLPALWRRAGAEAGDADEAGELDDLEEAAAPIRTRRALFRRREAEEGEDETLDAAEAAEETPHEPWRLRVPRLQRPRVRVRFPWRVRPGVLLFALAMFAVAAAGVMFNLGVLPSRLGDLWPLALAAAGAVLFPGALRQHDGGRLLMAFALAGVGVSLLLAETDLFPVRMTLSTALLVALGFTAMVRAVLVHGAE